MGYGALPLEKRLKENIKNIRNILIVWFLTGFWHGASWNFILWGLYFGVLLVIEKIFLSKFLNKTKVFKYIYTSLIVVISFLIFNASSLSDIGVSLKNMFFLNNIPLTGQVTMYYLRSYLVLFIIAIVGATPLFKNIFIKFIF